MPSKWIQDPATLKQVILAYFDDELDCTACSCNIIDHSTVRYYSYFEKLSAVQIFCRECHDTDMATCYTPKGAFGSSWHERYTDRFWQFYTEDMDFISNFVRRKIDQTVSSMIKNTLVDHPILTLTQVANMFSVSPKRVLDIRNWAKQNGQM